MAQRPSQSDVPKPCRACVETSSWQPGVIDQRFDKLVSALAARSDWRLIAERTRRSPHRYEWRAAEYMAMDDAEALGLSDAVMTVTERLLDIIGPASVEMRDGDRARLSAATVRRRTLPS